MTISRILPALLCAIPFTLHAQQTAPPADAIRVYLDCSYLCDDQFTRTEINYVNWVRDKADAQVHILISQLRNGGGGSEYTATFTGLKEFAGREDTLRYNAHTTDSEDAIRRALVRTMKFGLVPFIARTTAASRLQVTWGADTPEHKDAAAAPAHDPWDYWVFTVSGRSNFDGEASQHFTNLNGNLSANRTTDAFKIRIGFYGSYDESSFTYDPGTGTGDTTVVSIRRNYSVSALAVRSYGTHWSGGLESDASAATFDNLDLGLSAGPALEYSIWPYSEATRRSLTFRYSVSVRSNNYHNITIFDRMSETHPVHSLVGELNLRQRFGSVSLSTRMSQYLHNTSFYNASVFANTSVKLFKGFSVNFYGDYERVHDQLSLSAADLTPEEVLLRQRQLATTYRYWGGFGISYSFGSIFNNVVNPRFGENGGGIIIMN